MRSVELIQGNCVVTDEEMEEAAKVYLEAKDKNDTRTLDKLKNRFDGFQKIEDFITKKNQEQENAASLAAIQVRCSQGKLESIFTQCTVKCAI